IKAKYGTPINRWTTLRRRAAPVGLLTHAVESERDRSPIWRDVLSRYRIADVASIAFADRYGCWGFLDLWRDDHLGPFVGADEGLLAALAEPLTQALRRSQAMTFVAAATSARHDVGPVVLTLNDDLRILSRTAASQAWLSVLLPPNPGE